VIISASMAKGIDIRERVAEGHDNAINSEELRA
jgi:hypothetical protein